MPEPNSGCILWMRSLSRDGYGLAARKRRTIQAHRLSHEDHIGPIPAGMCVCHRCDVPSCVNPGHLFLGTNADNMADKVAKGRQARNTGENAGGVKLSAAMAAEILVAKDRQSEIAKRFGVSQRNVSMIKRRVTWRDLLITA